MNTISRIAGFLKLERLLALQSFYFWNSGLKMEKRLTELENRYSQQVQNLIYMKKTLVIVSKKVVLLETHNNMLETTVVALKRKLVDSSTNEEVYLDTTDLQTRGRLALFGLFIGVIGLNLCTKK